MKYLLLCLPLLFSTLYADKYADYEAFSKKGDAAMKEIEEAFARADGDIEALCKEGIGAMDEMHKEFEEIEERAKAYYKDADIDINEFYKKFTEHVYKKYEMKSESNIEEYFKETGKLGSYFRTNRLFTVEELRMLILNLIADFKDANEAFKQYPGKPTYFAEFISFLIIFNDDENASRYDCVPLVFLCNGNIMYFDLEEDDEIKSEEFLEEACEKANIDVATIFPISPQDVVLPEPLK